MMSKFLILLVLLNLFALESSGQVLSVSFEVDSLSFQCGEGNPYPVPSVVAECGLSSYEWQTIYTSEPCPEQYFRKYTAVDSCNQVVSDSIFIEILDTIPPTIVCPDNFLITTTNSWGARLGVLNFQVEEQCVPAFPMNGISYNDTLTEGIHTITTVVEDDCHMSTCSTEIEVVISENCVLPYEVELSLNAIPFSDEAGVSFYGDPNSEHFVEYGLADFLPLSGVGVMADVTPSYVGEYIYQSSDLGPLTEELIYDVYVHSVCAITSDTITLGPYQISYPTPPPLCGWDMENSCSLSIDTGFCDLYYLDSSLVVFDTQFSWCGIGEGAWYSFTAPESGAVLIDRTYSNFGTLVDADTNMVECWSVECLAYPQLPAIRIDDLIPGNIYYLISAHGLFWDASCFPFMISGGACVEVIPADLSIGGLEDMIVQCGDDIPILEPTVSNICAIESISFEDSLLTVSDECPQEWLREYTVLDSCGNSATDSQHILVIDTIAPLLTCPEVDSIFTDSDGAPYIFSNSNFEVEDCSATVPLLSIFIENEFLTIGTHTDIVSVADLCGNVSTCSYPYVVYNAVGLEESIFNDINIIQLDGMMNISYPPLLRGYTSQLYDLYGRSVRTVQLNGGSSIMDLTGLASGAYMLTFSDETTLKHSRKVQVH